MTEPQAPIEQTPPPVMETAMVLSQPGEQAANTLSLRSQMPQVSSRVKAEKLTPTGRKEFREAINRRSKSMTEALNTSIGGDVDEIISTLRAKAGITFTERQLNDLIKGCDEQIKGAVTEHLGPERRAIESDIEILNDDFDKREREMKARHKAEWGELGKERKTKQEELKNRLAGAEERVRLEHTPQIVSKKQQYMTELANVRETEARITAEADLQVRLIKTRKSQLKSLVDDSTSRALEQLLMVETREDAAALVNMIPTVQEALALSRSARGLAILMNRLDSSYPLPPEEEEKPKPVAKAAEPEAHIDGDIIDHEHEDSDDEDTDDDSDDDGTDDIDREIDEIEETVRDVAGDLHVLDVQLNGLDTRSQSQLDRDHDAIYTDEDNRSIRI